MKKRIVLVFIIFILILVCGNNIDNADSGSKPSIYIKIDNLNTDNYLIDLFEYSKVKEGETIISTMSETYFGQIAEERRYHTTTS